jgi:hypothetical protein
VHEVQLRSEKYFNQQVENLINKHLIIITLMVGSFRLLGHRKRCGNVIKIENAVSLQNPQINQQQTISFPTNIIQQTPRSPPSIAQTVELKEYLQNPSISQEIVWSGQSNNDTTFIEENVSNNPAQSTIEIINDDIRRHIENRSSTTNPGSSSNKRKSSSGSIDVALSSFLIGCNLTFDVIDSNHFKNFVNALNPDYKIPSSSQLTSRVLSQLKSMEDENGGKSRKKRRYYSSDSDSN